MKMLLQATYVLAAHEDCRSVWEALLQQHFAMAEGPSCKPACQSYCGMGMVKFCCVAFSSHIDHCLLCF